MKLIIERLRTQLNPNKQTMGIGFVVDNDGSYVYKFFTLELPDRSNLNNISRIPEGRYKVVKRNSAKYGNHFHILNVPNRDYILIHAGNYYTNTQGCVLVGNDISDINKDNTVDVINSGTTLKFLNAVLPKEFELQII